jgi:peptidoglycan/LPS O-acetylase OafA/YrhL
MKQRIETLDAFRGLAALSVVLFHYTTLFSNKFPNMYNIGDGFFAGHMGVHLFFMISGFVIFMTIEKVQSSKEFILKRFWRLFPTYWLCICLTSICIYAIDIPIDVFKISFKDIAINLTMIQGFFMPFIDVKSVDASYWSLLPELLFYTMIVVLYRFKLLRSIKIIGLIWLLLSVIWTIINRDYFMIGVFFNFKFGTLFFGGIMFYFLWKDKREKKEKSNHALIVLSCLVSVFMRMFYTQSYLYSAITVFFYLLFYLFVYGKLNLHYKPLLFLGRISYPWYLLHQMIGYAILYSLNVKFGFTSIFTIIIPILITGVMAFFVTEYYENIIVKKLKQLNKNSMSRK